MQIVPSVSVLKALRGQTTLLAWTGLINSPSAQIAASATENMVYVSAWKALQVLLVRGLSAQMNALTMADA